MSAHLSLIIGLVGGLALMFGGPAYFGAVGGPWWAAATWALAIGPMTRPITLYNNVRSVGLGALFWAVVGAIPYAIVAVGVWALTRWVWG